MLSFLEFRKNTQGHASARELICALKHLISAQLSAPLQHGGSKWLVGPRNSTQLKQGKPALLARQSERNTMSAHSVLPIKAKHESCIAESYPTEGWDLGYWHSEGWSPNKIF